jgi:hypothetical protein
MKSRRDKTLSIWSRDHPRDTDQGGDRGIYTFRDFVFIFGNY